MSSLLNTSRTQKTQNINIQNVQWHRRIYNEYVSPRIYVWRKNNFRISQETCSTKNLKGPLKDLFHNNNDIFSINSNQYFKMKNAICKNNYRAKNCSCRGLCKIEKVVYNITQNNTYNVYDYQMEGYKITCHECDCQESTSVSYYSSQMFIDNEPIFYPLNIWNLPRNLQYKFSFQFNKKIPIPGVDNIDCKQCLSRQSQQITLCNFCSTYLDNNTAINIKGKIRPFNCKQYQITSHFGCDYEIRQIDEIFPVQFRKLQSSTNIIPKKGFQGVSFQSKISESQKIREIFRSPIGNENNAKKIEKLSPRNVDGCVIYDENPDVFVVPPNNVYSLLICQDKICRCLNFNCNYNYFYNCTDCFCGNADDIDITPSMNKLSKINPTTNDISNFNENSNDEYPCNIDKYSTSSLCGGISCQFRELLYCNNDECDRKIEFLGKCHEINKDVITHDEHQLNKYCDCKLYIDNIVYCYCDDNVKYFCSQELENDCVITNTYEDKFQCNKFFDSLLQDKCDNDNYLIECENKTSDIDNQIRTFCDNNQGNNCTDYMVHSFPKNCFPFPKAECNGTEICNLEIENTLSFVCYNNTLTDCIGNNCVIRNSQKCELNQTYTDDNHTFIIVGIISGLILICLSLITSTVFVIYYIKRTNKYSYDIAMFV